jgi:hypothetical protein
MGPSRISTSVPAAHDERTSKVEKEKIVNFQKLFNVKTVVFCLGLAISASAQLNSYTNRPMPIAGNNTLYCAGYIQYNPMSTENRIIGSEKEADKWQYATQSDYMYLNMGANKGVSVGDILSVVRPRATVHSHWTDKGKLGFYVQEVGALEVVSVKREVSIARIKSACDVFLLGDLVQLTEKRTSPMAERRPPLDLFVDPSGKATGRIIMARDMADLITRDYVVYVDLGADNNLQVGDRLTVFRELGLGNMFTFDQHEDISARDGGYESFEYRGGKFSNMEARKRGSRATGKEVTTHMAKENRPDYLRQVVGEAVVLNVKEKTATVVITRTATEIHPGDWVEIQ